MIKDIFYVLKDLGNTEAMKVLHNIKDYPDMFESLKSAIPTVEIQGKETVDPEFQKMVLAFDPLGDAEEFCKEVGFDEKAIMGLGLLNIALSVAIKEVVRSMTMDFSERESTWEEYLNGVKSLGFVEVLELPKLNKYDEYKPTDDIVKYFWNYEHSILWIVDSYTSIEQRVNSSNIYLQGIKRDRSKYHELPINHSIAFNTDVSVMSCDMREMPTYKLFELLEKFQTTKYWLEYNCYSPELKQNFDQLPEDVQNYMTSRIALPMDLNKSHTQKTNMHKEAEAFIESLTEHDRKLGVSWVFRFGYENTKTTRLPESFYPLMERFTENVDVNFEAYVSALLFEIRKECDIKELDMFFVENVNDDVLEFVFKKLSKQKFHSMNKTAFAVLEAKFSNTLIM